MQQSAGSIQLKLYEDAIHLCGTAKVKLPKIAYVCTELSGAGLMGKLRVPYIGMIDNMTMEIEWDSPTGHAVNLLTPEKHQLDLRVAEEYWDTQETDVGIWPDKYVTIVRPEEFDPGAIAPMTAPGTKSQFVAYYFAAYRKGKQLWEVDKRNQKFMINGVDHWADVRSALGE